MIHRKTVRKRSKKYRRKLQAYSKAAALGALGCSSAVHGAITVHDIPDVTITNNAGTASQFIDIHADGPSNPDASAAEWQIMAPGVSTQIRIDKTFSVGIPGDEKPDHSDIGNSAIPAPSTPLITQGNQLLSGFNPTLGDAGYYTKSVPAGTLISRDTMAPSFYVGLAARTTTTYNVVYNFMGSGGYVGLEWDFDGTADVRYGWAQIDVEPANGEPNDFISATLTAYAFEMTPNTPIPAGVPEPGSLALLAFGGGGLALAARRRRLSGSQDK